MKKMYHWILSGVYVGGTKDSYGRTKWDAAKNLFVKHEKKSIKDAKRIINEDSVLVGMPIQKWSVAILARQIKNLEKELAWKKKVYKEVSK